MKNIWWPAFRLLKKFKFNVKRTKCEMGLIIASKLSYLIDRVNRVLRL